MGNNRDFAFGSKASTYYEKNISNYLCVKFLCYIS